jgi:cytosine/adenosine deaminase-related metal-dependent hydrolase
MDPGIGDLDRGDVLLENDVFIGVAEHIDASDAVVIDASDRVVMPGCVDTHRHTWQTAFRGVGVDWTFAEYLVAVHGTLKPHYLPEDVALGLRGPELTDMDTVAAELTLAADLGLRTSVHIETGGRCRPIADLHEHRLLSGTTTFVHANGVGDDELHMLADAGSSVSISPDVELKMGIGWPMTSRVLAAGLRPSLSTDELPTLRSRLVESRDRIAAAAGVPLDGTWHPSTDSH